MKTCVYANVFSNPSDLNSNTLLSKNSFAPHPYLIDLDYKNKKQKYKKGENFEFEVLLIGNAIQYSGNFIYAFLELGRKGVGKNYSSYKLLWVKNYDNTIYKNDINTIDIDKIRSVNSERIKEQSIKKYNIETFNSGQEVDVDLSFLTPTRIKYQGKFTDDIDFKLLIINAVRRLSLLQALYCNGSDQIDKKALKSYLAKASKIRVSTKDLNWQDWHRFSTKQKTLMKLGGFLGNIQFKGLWKDMFDYLYPLFLGEALHIGKNTSFGLGKYSINKIESIN